MLAQNVTSANITSVSADNKAAAINVKLIGNLTQTANGDFRQLRDLCYQMAKLDLSSASCTNIPKMRSTHVTICRHLCYLTMYRTLVHKPFLLAMR